MEDKLKCNVCNFVLTGSAKGTKKPEEGDVCPWCSKGHLILKFFEDIKD